MPGQPFRVGEPVDVGGVRLGPMLLGHYIALRAAGSPYVAERLTESTPANIALAVWIGSRESGSAAINGIYARNAPRRIRRVFRGLLKKTTRRGGSDWATLNEKLRRWARSQVGLPGMDPRHVRIQTRGVVQRPPVDYVSGLINAAWAGAGITYRHALETPLVTLNAIYWAHWETNGFWRSLPESEIAARARATEYMTELLAAEEAQRNAGE